MKKVMIKLPTIPELKQICNNPGTFQDLKQWTNAVRVLERDINHYLEKIEKALPKGTTDEKPTRKTRKRDTETTV